MKTAQNDRLHVKNNKPRYTYYVVQYFILLNRQQVRG